MQTLPVLQRTSETQTFPDRCTRETQTPSLYQRTVGTQVEITTGSLGAGPPDAPEGPRITRGRGRGLRPVQPSELMPVGSRGLTPTRGALPLPREAPPPSLLRGRSPQRAVRRSPQPSQIIQDTEETGSVSRPPNQPEYIQGAESAPPVASKEGRRGTNRKVNQPSTVIVGGANTRIHRLLELPRHRPPILRLSTPT